MMGGRDGNSKWHDNGAILPVKHPSKLGKEKSVLELEMLTSNIERDMMHGSKACPPFYSYPPSGSSISLGTASGMTMVPSCL